MSSLREIQHLKQQDIRFSINWESVKVDGTKVGINEVSVYGNDLSKKKEKKFSAHSNSPNFLNVNFQCKFESIDCI